MWVQKYIGKKWTKQRDCFYWFATIQKNEFGRRLPIICNYNDTARTLNRAVKARRGWRQIDFPIKDGDAVFLSQKTIPHHIGTVAFIGKKMNVLHAASGSGITLSDIFSLHCNLWEIVSYWTYENKLIK